MFGLAQPFQVMPAHVSQSRAVGQPITDLFCGLVRQQYLTAIPARHHTLHARHGEVTSITALVFFGKAGVQPYPDLDRRREPSLGRKLALRIQSGLQRVAGILKCGTVGVANNKEDKPSVGFNSPVQDFIVPGKQGRNLVRVLLGEFCAAFDVREQKSD